MATVRGPDDLGSRSAQAPQGPVNGRAWRMFRGSSTTVQRRHRRVWRQHFRVCQTLLWGVWGGRQQADPLQFLTYARHIETQDIEYSGKQVSQLHLLGHPLPGGKQLRIAHDQGHVNKRVVQTIGMAHEAMI